MNCVDTYEHFRSQTLKQQVDQIRWLDMARFTREEIGLLTGCCQTDIERVISGRNMPL